MAHATPDAERAVRAHNEIWNEQDYAQIPDVVSESYIEYNPAAPEGEIRGPDGLEEWMRGITTAFPDIQAELLDAIADEETVMAEVRFTMTHEGEFNGVPPTGREVEFQAMAKFRVEDGNIIELRNYFDPQELFDQLGVTPESAEEQEHPSPATSRSENEQLARDHFTRVWNHGEFDTDVLTDDYRVHLNLGGHETYTLDEFREFVTRVREAIPDLHKEPDDVFATDDKVTIRYTMTGTQEGEFEGIPGTGDEIEINAIAIYRVEDRGLAECWLVADFLRAMKQLGIVEPPEE